MDAHCDLEVDVNGEEVFMVDKRVISTYSGRISKLLSKSKGVNHHLKVIFNDFPGGAANFELITRFCYNKGNINISPSNISNLTCAAYFMEMNRSIAATDNLCEKTEKSMEGIRYWSWSELMVALKKCQDLPEESSSIILDKFFNSLIARVVSSCESSPCPSTFSPDSPGFRLSCDTRSTESSKINLFRLTWWFEDLVPLNSHLIEKLVKLMVTRNFDNGVISKFLFHYQKSRFVSASLDEKIEIVKTVIEMLSLLDITDISYRGLFGLLRVTLNLKNLNECCKRKLESMIGSQLDEATLDNLLVPSRLRKSCLYDVDLVLRFLKSFIGKGACCVPLTRLKKVSRLMDLYLAEVAPDRYLKPTKFLDLIGALPDFARDSFDRVYHAVNLYLEVHSGLSEEERVKICNGVNYEKLSTEAFNHLTETTNIPSKSTVQALISQQRKLKSLLQDTNQATVIPFNSFETMDKGRNKEGSDQQIVLYAKKLNLADESDKLKSHLQGMQWRVTELEKVCRKMQNQMGKMMKSRLSSQSNAKSVPRLCS